MGILTEDAACNLRGDIVIFTLFVIVIFVCMGVIHNSLRKFFKRLRAANSAVLGRIMPNLNRDIMVVLHTCKNEVDLIKNEGARELTRLYDAFFRR